MRKLLRHLSISTSRPRSNGLTLLLLLAVLIPSVCLIWFMNQAVQNEKLAVRQGLMDVYRGNLTLAQGRLEEWHAQVTHDLETNNLPGPTAFGTAVRDGLADSLICFNSAGEVTYPAPEHPAAADSSALVFQAQARAARTNAAGLILDALRQGKFSRSTDDQGRLIMPNLELMAFELTNEPGLLHDLQTELNDYNMAMPSAQRRFLMHRLTALFPGRTAFPTLAAEDLAARYLEAGPQPQRDSKLTATSMPGVWQMSAENGHALLLFRAETLPVRLAGAALHKGLPPAVSLTAIMPGKDAGNYLLTMPAGDNFPGWQLALNLKDGDVFKAAAEAQIGSYVWVGMLTMTVVVILALFVAGLIRRQAAVAQLRNDLLANVTHELKTPLSSMRLLVDTLLQSRPIHEETARQYLELIAAENLRLSRLIDNFLAFSRIERNKLAFDFAPVSPEKIVERASAAVKERFAASGCQFAVQSNGGLPRIAADADALVTVLLNLLDNAWKYSGDDRQITLSVGAQNGHVIFAVKDNGIGLSPRETNRIFKRFYQVDQRLARTGGGCGLGLSIVQFIVTAHHGAVRVESEPNRGSTFFVTLPATEVSP